MSTTQLNSLRPYLKEEDKRACAQFCIFHVTPYMTHYLMNQYVQHYAYRPKTVMHNKTRSEMYYPLLH